MTLILLDNLNKNDKNFSFSNNKNDNSTIDDIVESSVISKKGEKSSKGNNTGKDLLTQIEDQINNLENILLQKANNGKNIFNDISNINFSAKGGKELKNEFINNVIKNDKDLFIYELIDLYNSIFQNISGKLERNVINSFEFYKEYKDKYKINNYFVKEDLSYIDSDIYEDTWYYTDIFSNIKQIYENGIIRYIDGNITPILDKEKTQSELSKKGFSINNIELSNPSVSIGTPKILNFNINDNNIRDLGDMFNNDDILYELKGIVVGTRENKDENFNRIINLYKKVDEIQKKTNALLNQYNNLLNQLIYNKLNKNKDLFNYLKNEKNIEKISGKKIDSIEKEVDDLTSNPFYKNLNVDIEEEYDKTGNAKYNIKIGKKGIDEYIKTNFNIKDKTSVLMKNGVNVGLENVNKINDFFKKDQIKGFDNEILEEVKTNINKLNENNSIPLNIPKKILFTQFQKTPINNDEQKDDIWKKIESKQNLFYPDIELNNK